MIILWNMSVLLFFFFRRPAKRVTRQHASWGDRVTFFLFLFILFNVMPLIWATETVLDVYTLNKTSQEFSYINFITRYRLIIMNYILYRSSLVSLPSKNTEEDKIFDEMKHVSIVHVCSCLFCIKKDYIAMCVMFDKYTCFAARLM